MGIIYVDNPDNAGSYLYHPPTTEGLNYISSTFNKYVESVKEYAPDLAVKLRNRYDTLMSSETVNYIKGFKNRLSRSFQSNSIQYLESVARVQQAPDVMRRYIMAEPNLRELYHNNSVAGYDGFYVDNHPHKIGIDHYDYRRITDGVNIEMEDFIGYRTFDEYVPEEDVLSIFQKCSILASHRVVREILESEVDMRDPSSIYGGTR